jgi:4'-phosphopantetheinyl transferase
LADEGLHLPMYIYWLEQNEPDLPRENHWLSGNEVLRLNAMQFPKRRADWRLGRWTAKNAVASYLRRSHEQYPLTEIEIRSASSGAPEVFLGRHPADVTISLSHRDGIAACAVARGNVLLGCDLEIVEPHGNTFLSDYFTDEEQALFAWASNTNFLSSLLWSAKESALKALHAGLRLDTRSVVVQLPVQQHSVRVAGESVWTRLEVRHEDGRLFNGWWQHSGKLIRTLVSEPVSPFPIFLNEHRYCQSGSENHAGALRSASVSPA